MRLVHHTAEPFEYTPARYYPQEPAGGFHVKPRGLWLSDEDDFGWSEWCRDQGFALETLTYASEFAVEKPERVLCLSTVSDLNAFTSEYGKTPSYAQRSPFLSDLKMVGIDWQRVAMECGGILITPYQWRSRMDLMWYYGWDVASACIWDLSVIREVTSFETDEPVIPGGYTMMPRRQS